MTETEFPHEAVTDIADIFKKHDSDTGINGGACLAEAASVCEEHGIERMDERIDLICEGAGWYMEREKLDLQQMLRTELTGTVEEVESGA